MSLGQGHDSWVGIGVQTVLGTPVVASQYLDFISEGIEYQPTRGHLVNAGAVDPSVHKELYRRSGGPIEVYANYEGLETLLLFAFGDVTTTTESGAAKRHTYALAKNLPGPGLTLEVNRSVEAFLYEGCKVNEVEFIQEAEDFLRVRFGLLGRNETLDETPTEPTASSFPAELQILGAHLSAILRVNGASPVADLPLVVNRLSLMLNNAAAHRASTGIDSKEIVRTGKRAITFSADLDFDAVTRYDEYRALTDMELVLTWTGAEIIPGFNYTLNLTLPRFNWDGKTPTVAGPGPITVEMAGTAMDTERFAQDAITGYLINTVTAVEGDS